MFSKIPTHPIPAHFKYLLSLINPSTLHIYGSEAEPVGLKNFVRHDLILLVKIDFKQLKCYF
jgi:hypothetical protein